MLAFTEVANALLGYVRAGALTLEDADERSGARVLPLRLHGPELAPAALGAAVELGLSAYDGTYAALAESLDAVARHGRPSARSRGSVGRACSS